jgi:erythritol transport system ATP-binding protein
VEHMTGRVAQDSVSAITAVAGAEALRVDSIRVIGSTQDGATQPLLEDVSFSVSTGEILGIYGLLGAGRTELLETLAGARAMSKGRALLRGKPLPGGSVEKNVKRGIVLMPEDRQSDGLIPSLSIRENISLADFKGLKSGAFLSRRKEMAKVRSVARQVGLKVDNFELPVTSLSGGNQQKVMLARCLMRWPSILLLDEPTRGVDVGAKQEIHRILRDLKATGVSIIFTSSEIEETRALADRILVLSAGKISAEFAAGDASEEALFAAACAHLETQGAVQ